MLLAALIAVAFLSSHYDRKAVAAAPITPSLGIRASTGAGVHPTWSSSPLMQLDPTLASPIEAELPDGPFDTNYRSTTDLVWSCIVTVFACTWLSVHPNVSGYDSTWKQRFLHRLYLMIWGIAAPEFLVIFAYRQWMGSKEITCAVEKMVKVENLEIEPRRKWTLAHSHFLQMGGFMFTDPSSSSLTVDFIEVQELIRSGSKEVGNAALRLILQCNPSEDEIWDRSKADTLAKSVVALQALWFLAQTVSRAVQHVTITELEVITLAYAAFNAGMYAFWWDKPLDVQCPIVIPFPNLQRLRLYKESSVIDTVTNFSFHGSGGVQDDDASFILEFQPSLPPRVALSFERPGDKPSHHGISLARRSCPELGPLTPLPMASFHRRRNEPPSGASLEGRSQHGSILRDNDQSQPAPAWPGSRWVNRLINLVHSPLNIMHRVYILTGFKRAGRDYVFSVFNHRKPGDASTRRALGELSDPSSVPMFYAYSEAPDYAPRSIMISALAMFLASCFGAIHCSAWYFSRLTTAETVLWRTSALLICLSPVVSCITFLAATWFSWLLDVPARWWVFLLVKKALMNVLAPFHNHVFIPLLLPTYLIARLVLIGLALAQLRRLPHSAHKTVEWLNFVPHI